MFKKLLDFDEVCFEGAVVEEERRVGPGGQVFELGRLPGEDGDRWRGRRAGKGGDICLGYRCIHSIRLLSSTSKTAVRIKCGTVD